MDDPRASVRVAVGQLDAGVSARAAVARIRDGIPVDGPYEAINMTTVPNVWIVLVNYNGLEDTCGCLESIAKIEYPRLTTVVVDNASRVDPRAVIDERFGWCRVIRNRVNGGWAGGNNVGLRAALIAGANLVVLLNNDTVVSPRFIERLVAAAAAHPDFGIFGPAINEMSEPAVVQTDGVLFNHEREAGFFSREAVPLDAEQPAV